VAIGFVNQGSSADPDFNISTDSASYDSAIWTPPASGLVCVWVHTRVTGGSPNTSASVTGNGLTWAEAGTMTFSTTRRVSLFVANASGATSGSTKFLFDNTQLHCDALFFSVDGAHLSDGSACAIRQLGSASGSGTSGCITLAAAGDTNNRPISSWKHLASEGTAPRTNWTELDVWQYVYQEHIDIVPLYFAKERPVVKRNGNLIMVDDERFRLLPGEKPEMKIVRFRTLGCYPLSGAIESTAASLPEIIQEMLLTRQSERQGRVIDYDEAASMEKKKREGYF